MTKRSPNKPLAAVLLAVFILMLVFNAMTPMAGDDFAHYYGFGESHVASLRDIFASLAQFRQQVNGRVFAHFFVYLMQVPPRPFFAVLNAAVVPLLLWLLLRYLPEGEQDSAFLAIVAAMLLWLFMPAFGEAFLWLTGSCNYGWALPLHLVLLYPFFCRYTGRAGRSGGWRAAALLLLSFVGGAYGESGAVGLIAAMGLFLLLILLREKRVPAQLLLMLLAACAGFLFLLLAPATLASRTGDLSLHGLMVGLKADVECLERYFRLFYLLYALLLAQAWLCGGDRRRIAASLTLIAAGLLSGLSLAAAAYIPARGFTVQCAYTLLACLLLLGELRGAEHRRLRASVAAVLTVLFLFAFVSGAGDILSLFAQSRTRASVIREALLGGETSVTLREYVTGTRYTEITDEGLAESADDWYNQRLAWYYGFDKVYGELPFD